MTKDLNKAISLLDSGDYTCVLCREETVFTATERGVAPLLNWVNEGFSMTGFSAADRVVGRATAFLYVLLGVRAVHARVMSRPAASVLDAHGIRASWDTLTDGILNRRGDGPCPFEAEVMTLEQPMAALAAIRDKSARMGAGTLLRAGIQVSSIKPLLQTPEQVSTAFANLAALKAPVMQLQWIDPRVPIDHIAAALKENGLYSVSVQDFFGAVDADFAYYRDLNAATGGKWLCLSRIPQECKSPEGLDRFVVRLREMQARLEGLGQSICFHPVGADYTAVPGMNAVEYLMQAMPELSLCVDLYHLNRCCPDMPGFLRRYAGRICMVHFKDGRGDDLVPAGQGDTNWDGVVQACLDAGVPYAFVEQERWDRDPYECLGEALDWLHGQTEAARKN